LQCAVCGVRIVLHWVAVRRMRDSVVDLLHSLQCVSLE
jgi:hypothetical protein